MSLLKQNPEQIDLVITDLQMPCLDGIELAAELLKINAALPVVLTSAAKLQMPSEKLQSLGLRDFLTKPWDRDRLFAVVRQALASTPVRREELTRGLLETTRIRRWVTISLSSCHHLREWERK